MFCRLVSRTVRDRRRKDSARKIVHRKDGRKFLWAGPADVNGSLCSLASMFFERAGSRDLSVAPARCILAAVRFPSEGWAREFWVAGAAVPLVEMGALPGSPRIPLEAQMDKLKHWTGHESLDTKRGHKPWTAGENCEHFAFTKPFLTSQLIVMQFSLQFCFCSTSAGH